MYKTDIKLFMCEASFNCSKTNKLPICLMDEVLSRNLKPQMWADTEVPD